MTDYYQQTARALVQLVGRIEARKRLIDGGMSASTAQRLLGPDLYEVGKPLGMIVEAVMKASVDQFENVINLKPRRD